MKPVLLTLLLLGMVAGGAVADPTDLSGGVFITHYVPELGYSTEPPPVGDWCEAYEEYAIQSCQEQNTRIDVPADSLACSWFVIAAWWEEKEWCGTEFGFGDFDPELFGFVEWHPCFPPGGGLEIHWWNGEPNSGTAFIATPDPWTGNFVPLYWLGGYAYSGEGVIPLDVDPPTGFAGFVNCLSPPQAWEAVDLGGMGINTDGIACCPSPPPEAVCCFIDGSCLILTEEECDSLGGGFFPEWNSCDPNPCSQPTACCVGEDCYLIWHIEDCEELGGVFLPGYLCDPNPCPVAVCCVGLDCYIVPSVECDQMGGVFHPEWTTCDPNPCEITPARRATWGSVKRIYR